MIERAVEQIKERSSFNSFVCDLIFFFVLFQGMILLYKEERGQYNKWREGNAGVAQCDYYGTEHLLRLVAKLPGFFSLQHTFMEGVG